MASLVRRQLEQTRKELEREQRSAARERLQGLRSELKAARERRRERMKAVGSDCRSARKRISDRARAARERLNAAIARSRENAKQSCNTVRGEVQSEALAELGRALGALDLERGLQRQLAAWTRPATSTTSTAREKRSESDDEVRANIEDSAMLAVWERVKGRIKGRGRTSRTEAFAEWIASHSAEVYEIQNAELEREIAELEREERALVTSLKKRQPRAPRALAAVPF